jgi:hypothetical protein
MVLCAPCPGFQKSTPKSSFGPGKIGGISQVETVGRQSRGVKASQEKKKYRGKSNCWLLQEKYKRDQLRADPGSEGEMPAQAEDFAGISPPHLGNLTQHSSRSACQPPFRSLPW